MHRTTRMATEEFLRTGDPAVIGSRDDCAPLLDLKDAAAYVTGCDYDARPFDPDRFTGVNASRSRTAAIEPGALRTAANVQVRTQFGSYTPPPVGRALVERVVGVPVDAFVAVVARHATMPPVDPHKPSQSLANRCNHAEQRPAAIESVRHHTQRREETQ